MIEDITDEDKKLRSLVVYELSEGLVELPVMASAVHERFAFYKRMIQRKSASLGWLEERIVAKYGIEDAVTEQTLADAFDGYEADMKMLVGLFGNLLKRKLLCYASVVLRPIQPSSSSV